MKSDELKHQLAAVIRHYNTKGWSPATSTNYSFRDENDQIWVSRSGVDKYEFDGTDFITVNENGEAMGAYEGTKPSAETLIHCVLYELFPATRVILHSHSVFPVALSAKYKDELSFEGFEVQKGFSGQLTHENKIHIPIFNNTQDMFAFRDTLRNEVNRILHHSFIMRKHGTYAWGNSLYEAKRHLESLEYLCECTWRIENHKLF